MEEKEVKTRASAIDEKASEEGEKSRAMSETLVSRATRSYIGPPVYIKPRFQDEIYTRGRGYALYISNFYEKSRPRLGAEQDEVTIKTFFEGFDYEYDFRSDVKTPNELWEIINDVKTKVERNKEKYKSFFIIISSHGKGITLRNEVGRELPDDEGKPIVVADNIQLLEPNTFVRVDQIVSKFKDFMTDKPKVLMFQNCRNVPGVEKLVSDSKDFCYSGTIPQIADMVVIHDTGKGGKGWVDRNGAWMFQCLFVDCRHMYDNEHFLDVLTQMNHIVSRREDRDKSGFIANQMPCFTSTFTKFFYL